MLRRFVFVAVAAALAASPALADKGKGKSKGRGREGGVVEERGRREVVVFNDRDREAVRTYWVQTYGPGNCSPGLAKKHNGCLPPGLAKRRYVVGRPLPASVRVEPLPPVLVTRLGPPPAGYEYAVVDGDVVKLAVGTRLVVDAINAILR